jgi:hypothetical protein
MSDLHSKRIFFFLKPDKLGFKITNALLKTSHLVDHAEIGPADVAE